MSWQKTVGRAAAIVVVLGGGAAALYYYMQQIAPPPAAPAPAQPRPIAPPPPAPAPQVLEAPPAPPRLPGLAESDSYVLGALTRLLGNPSLAPYLQTDKIIHRVVATVDSLPRNQVGVNVMPVLPPTGMFQTTTQDNDIILSPDNAARYNVYVRLADAVDPRALVALYLRLYPLFQQAYVDLGYPGKYFNDRLMDALDDLLAAPDIKGPVKLVQPHVLYQFADPDLEQPSVGQKIMIRLGPANEAIIKAKLLAIRTELKRHMHDARLAGGK